MGYTKQVVFKVGNESYGLDILKVNAIEDYDGVVPIPNAPENILGILNLRGEIIPVFSLRKKFSLLEIPADDKTQLIVTRSNSMPVGFKVDSVEEISEIDGEDLHPMPVITQGDLTSYASCVANKDGKLIVLIDNDNVINKREQKAASDIIDSNS